MHRTEQGSIVPPVLIAALGAAVLAVTRSIPRGGLADDPGPAFLPTVAGLGLVVCGAWLMWRRDPHDGLPRGAGLLRVGGTALLVLGYLLLIEPMGFITATALFLAAEMWLIGVRRRYVLLLLPVLLSAGVYLMFRYGLEVPLPATQLGGVTL